MWREELLNNKWPHINEEIALRYCQNATEQRCLCALTCKIKCNWENETKEGELRLGAERELDCM
jgi:hypothetical protein